MKETCLELTGSNPHTPSAAAAEKHTVPELELERAAAVVAADRPRRIEREDDDSDDVAAVDGKKRGDVHYATDADANGTGNDDRHGYARSHSSSEVVAAMTLHSRSSTSD